MDWVAFKNQFFSSVIISKDGFDKGADLESTVYNKESQDNWKVCYLKDFKAGLKTAFDPSGRKATEPRVLLWPERLLYPEEGGEREHLR